MTNAPKTLDDATLDQLAGAGKGTPKLSEPIVVGTVHDASPDRRAGHGVLLVGYDD